MHEHGFIWSVRAEICLYGSSNFFSFFSFYFLFLLSAHEARGVTRNLGLRNAYTRHVPMSHTKLSTKRKKARDHAARMLKPKFFSRRLGSTIKAEYFTHPHRTSRLFNLAKNSTLETTLACPRTTEPLVYNTTDKITFEPPLLRALVFDLLYLS